MTIKDKKKYEEVDARLEQLLEKGTELVVYGREREFMLQIEVFIPEFGEISVVQCVFLIAFGDG